MPIAGAWHAHSFRQPITVKADAGWKPRRGVHTHARKVDAPEIVGARRHARGCVEREVGKRQSKLYCPVPALYMCTCCQQRVNTVQVHCLAAVQLCQPERERRHGTMFISVKIYAQVWVPHPVGAPGDSPRCLACAERASELLPVSASGLRPKELARLGSGAGAGSRPGA